MCWIAAALMCWAVLAGATAALDLRLSAAAVAASEASPRLAGVLRGVTALGDWEVRSGIAAAFFLYLAWRRLARAASYLLYTTLGCWALVAWGLKPLLARARPETAGELVGVGPSLSLPSAHAANTAAIATAIALVAGVLWWRRRHAIRAAAAAVVLAVGLSRVWLGVHWPSDVIAGWLVGAGVALLLAAAIRPVVPAGQMEQRRGAIGSSAQRFPNRS